MAVSYERIKPTWIWGSNLCLTQEYWRFLYASDADGESCHYFDWSHLFSYFVLCTRQQSATTFNKSLQEYVFLYASLTTPFKFWLIKWLSFLDNKEWKWVSEYDNEKNASLTREKNISRAIKLTKWVKQWYFLQFRFFSSTNQHRKVVLPKMISCLSGWCRNVDFVDI